MADANIFWRPDTFGLTMWGREYDVNDRRYYCFDRNTKLILLDATENDKVREKAEAFFGEKGFVYIYIYTEDEEKVANCMKEAEDPEHTAFILLSNKAFTRFEDFFRRTGYPFQLFSVVKLFFELWRPQLRRVYDLLEDDRSRESFSRALAVRYKLAPYSFNVPTCEGNQYFCIPEMRRFSPDDVFVDCGAYVGETIEKYLFNREGEIHAIHAFEPGERAFQALTERRSRLIREWALKEDQLVINKAGVGERSGKASLITGDTNELTSLKISDDADCADGEEIQIVDLDTYFGEKHVSFIKADIEGSEMAMLRGARTIIQRDKPMLAICLYHSLSDYYEIPLYLKELAPEYRFWVRHHTATSVETVLYACCD